MRIGKKTTFLCDCIFIDVRIYSPYAHSTFLHMQRALDLYLKKVGLIDQDQSTHFSSSNLSLILGFLCLAGSFPTSPLWLNWSRATFVTEMSKCLSEVGFLQLCELLGLHTPCYSL